MFFQKALVFILHKKKYTCRHFISPNEAAFSLAGSKPQKTWKLTLRAWRAVPSGAGHCLWLSCSLAVGTDPRGRGRPCCEQGHAAVNRPCQQANAKLPLPCLYQNQLSFSFPDWKPTIYLLLKISPNNPRVKVLSNLNLETGLPMETWGFSKWYHSSFSPSQPSPPLSNPSQVEKLSLQRLRPMFQEVVCFFNRESTTVHFWARVQWA